jgi:galactokinase
MFFCENLRNLGGLSFYFFQVNPTSGMDASTIKNHFRQQFGAEPQIIVRAPGRINLIGEHTDYNGGLVLPAAIDRAIWLALSPRADHTLALYAADLDEFFLSEKNGAPVFQQEKTWANYLLGTLSEARKDGLKIGGLNLAFGGDVPLGAGLSSSAAIQSGMLFALNEVFQLRLPRMHLVRLAQRSENNFVGMKCGIMDMFASLMGRANHVVRLDCRSLDFQYFPFEAPSLSLLLLDSGVKHQLLDSEYNARRAECEAGVEALKKLDPKIEALRDVAPSFLEKHRAHLPPQIFRRCQFVVEEIARVEAACGALQSGDFEQLGSLMFAGHEGLHTLYEVCVPETHFLVEQARGHVLGARQMGGGFGGCTLNLLKTADLAPFLAATTAAYRRAFGLELRAYPVRLTGGVEQVPNNPRRPTGINTTHQPSFL